MLDQLIPLMASPWIYALVIGAVALDAVLPVLPSESVVIALGAFAVTGTPRVAPLVCAAAVGGLLGDAANYGLGRVAGGLGARSPGRLGRLGRLRARAQGALLRHGGKAVLVGRFLPGGRSATTLAAGSARYPWRRFALVSGAASGAWAVYVTALGYVGGSAFRDRPLLGMIPGIVLGFGLAAGHAVHRRRVTPITEHPNAEPPNAEPPNAEPPNAESERTPEPVG